MGTPAERDATQLWTASGPVVGVTRWARMLSLDHSSDPVMTAESSPSWWS